MGRKGKYETHVLPYLQQISEWCSDYDEKQIADMLGIAQISFERYKKQHKELQEALRHGRMILVSDLKASLKKKAKGFYYDETKTTIREEGGKRVQIIEKFKKYAQPDTGAIHLLLKNNDPNWTNDDQTILALKRKQLEIAEQKAEADNW